MIKSLRKRFIVFSVLVISIIVLIAALLIFVGSDSPLSTHHLHRYSVTFVLTVAMVFAGSWLLSKAAIKPIQEAWQKQLDFTADASHELRTPIAVIQTNLELVMDSPEETVESQMKWLKNIEAEHKRMARLVEDLLTLSRADTGQQTTEKETFMLEEAVTGALMPLLAVAEAKGVELCVRVKEKPTFYGDRKRIMQLAVILADNALRYTEVGKVTAMLTKSEKDLTLTVSDTGRGIKAEDLSKIFDRFYRAADTRGMHQDGSGLGLSIAKWIVREHGGTIRAQSTPGLGTDFTVVLPYNTDIL